jgi:hypothetical protein
MASSSGDKLTSGARSAASKVRMLVDEKCFFDVTVYSRAILMADKLVVKVAQWTVFSGLR